MKKIIVMAFVLLLAVPAIAQDNELTPFENNGKWGLKDAVGKVVLKPKYNDIHGVEHGIAIVDMSKVRKARALIGYEKNSRFSQQTFAVYNLELPNVGCVNVTTGKEIVPTKYGMVKVFENNLIAVKKDGMPDHYWLNYDHHGNQIKPTKYAKLEDVKNGMIRVYSPDRKIGYLDIAGNEIVPVIYNSIGNLHDSEVPVQVSIGDKYGALDPTTHEVIIPVEYDVLNPFDEGYATVRKDEKWGVLDIKGNVTAPLIYDYCSGSLNGLVAVSNNGKSGVVDYNNNEVLPFIYENAYPFSEGLAAVKKNGKWGFVDQNGKEVIPFVYDEVHWIYIKSDRKSITGFVNNKALVRKDGEIFYINKKGAIIEE